MNEAKCEGCGAVYLVKENLPREMQCFCKNTKFTIKQKNKIKSE